MIQSLRRNNVACARGRPRLDGNQGLCRSHVACVRLWLRRIPVACFRLWIRSQWARVGAGRSLCLCALLRWQKKRRKGWRGRRRESGVSFVWCGVSFVCAGGVSSPATFMVGDSCVRSTKVVFWETFTFGVSFVRSVDARRSVGE